MLNYLKRDDANTSKKLPLDSTEKEEYYLMVSSIHSDEYRLNKSKIYQAAATPGTDIHKTKHEEIACKIIAAAITDWNVPKEYKEYSQDNVIKLLMDYPQVSDAVELFSSDMSRYIAKK